MILVHVKFIVSFYCNSEAIISISHYKQITSGLSPLKNVVVYFVSDV